MAGDAIRIARRGNETTVFQTGLFVDLRKNTILDIDLTVEQFNCLYRVKRNYGYDGFNETVPLSIIVVERLPKRRGGALRRDEPVFTVVLS